jgi:hypothetical protein
MRLSAGSGGFGRLSGPIYPISRRNLQSASNSKSRVAGAARAASALKAAFVAVLMFAGSAMDPG